MSSHIHCEFCKNGKNEKEFACDVCGTKFIGRHFHFYNFNFCTSVCAKAMRDYNTPYDEADDPEIVGFFWKNV